MNSLIHTIQRNTFFSFISNGTRILANAVLFVLVAKFYGPVLFGQFTMAHTLAIIFTLIADFGFDILLTTEIARSREKIENIVPRMFCVKLILSLTALLLMCGYGVIQDMSDGARILVLIFSLYLFFSALLGSLFALFKGHDELHHESQITFIMNLTLLGVLVLFGSLHVRLEYVALAFVGSRILGLMLALIKSSRFVPRIKPIWDFLWFKTIWKEVSVFGIFFIFGNLYFLLDTILISIWKGDHEVGIYQSVFRIIAMMLIISDITVGAILPSLSRLYEIDKKGWSKLGSVVSKALFHIGLLIGFFLITQAEQIVSLIYGTDYYEPAIPIMRIFGLIVIIRYGVEIPALMLTTAKKQHTRMILVIAATIFNFALNFYLIPRYGIIGAASVSLVTNFLLGISYIISIKKIFQDTWFSIDRIIPLITIVLAIVIITILQFSSFWISAIFAFLIYIPIVFTVGYNIEEKKYLVQSTLSVFNR
jgi:O-antigen/teichoic acid export membrane protein